MAASGPQKISADEIKKFQAILKLPAGDEKNTKIKALSAEEKLHFRTYTDILKQQQVIKKLEALQQKESELAALQAREQELLKRDKTALTYSASAYSKSIGSVTAPNVVPTSRTTPSLKS